MEQGQSCIETRKPCIWFFMVIKASGMHRGRVRSTYVRRKTNNVAQTLWPYSRNRLKSAYIFDIKHIHTMFNWQPSKQGICCPVSYDIIAGSVVKLIKVAYLSWPLEMVLPMDRGLKSYLICPWTVNTAIKWLFEGILFICARVVSFVARAGSPGATDDTTREQINNIPEGVILLTLLSTYKAKSLRCKGNFICSCSIKELAAVSLKIMSNGLIHRK